jgi:hypothetical protein
MYLNFCKSAVKNSLKNARGVVPSNFNDKVGVMVQNRTTCGTMTHWENFFRVNPVDCCN